MAISQITLLDASRRWFQHVSGSTNFTRPAREQALKLMRAAETELGAVAAAMAGHPAQAPTALAA